MLQFARCRCRSVDTVFRLAILGFKLDGQYTGNCAHKFPWRRSKDSVRKEIHERVKERPGSVVSHASTEPDQTNFGCRRTSTSVLLGVSLHGNSGASYSALCAHSPATCSNLFCFFQPDSKTLFDFEFDNIQFSKQSLQDFAWEEIYKFRPLLRPLGPNLTVKHYDVMRARMARKKKAKEEKYTLHMATAKLGEMKIHLPSLVHVHPMPSIASVLATTHAAPLAQIDKVCVQPTGNISNVGPTPCPGPEKRHLREDDEVAAINLARLSS
jgi:hypothetical protein